MNAINHKSEIFFFNPKGELRFFLGLKRSRSGCSDLYETFFLGSIHINGPFKHYCFLKNPKLKKLTRLNGVVWVGQPITLSLPTRVEVELGCDNLTSEEYLLNMGIGFGF